MGWQCVPATDNAVTEIKAAAVHPGVISDQVSVIARIPLDKVRVGGKIIVAFVDVVHKG